MTPRAYQVMFSRLTLARADIRRLEKENAVLKKTIRETSIWGLIWSKFLLTIKR